MTLSLPEQIAEKIGNSIIRGEYEPAARIPEVEVAGAFAVSRAPVREALRILERDGLVQINARRGAQVTKLSSEEINEMFVVRASMLGLAAALAAKRQNPDFVAQLQADVPRLGQLARNKDADAFVSIVYELSVAIAEHSGNRVLSNLLFSLAHQTLRYARLGLATPERREQAAADWVGFLDAVERKKPRIAQKTAEKLVRDVRDTAIQTLGRPPEPSGAG